MSLKSPVAAVRIVFLLFALGGGYLVFFASHTRDGPADLPRHLMVATLLALMLVFVDMMLKGFSLRSLTSLTFGLAVGAITSSILSVSPLFDLQGFIDDQDIRERVFAVKCGVFIATTYLATVITLRARDEFNLVIPYIRFNPLDTRAHLVVLDATALIDGRITRLCETGFFTAELVAPRFVLDELHVMANTPEAGARSRGRRGLTNLNALKLVPGVHLRTHESGAAGAETSSSDRLVALARSLKGTLLTTDHNVAQIARFHEVKTLDLNALANGMKYELAAGDVVEVQLARQGREPGQAVGHLSDGSMIVVADAAHLLDRTVAAEVMNITPNAAGRIIFAKVRAEF